MSKITTIISDFSYVLLFPKDASYKESINQLHQQLAENADYSLFNTFYLNEPLLEMYRQLSESKDLFIFTDGLIHLQPEIRTQLDPIFKEAVSVKALGLKKDNPQAFEAITKQLHLNPLETLFIDDREVNIEAAQAAGFQTHRFENTEETIEYLKLIIKK